MWDTATDARDPHLGSTDDARRWQKAVCVVGTYISRDVAAILHVANNTSVTCYIAAILQAAVIPLQRPVNSGRSSARSGRLPVKLTTH